MMQSKLIGIFILLSFLMLRSSGLMAAYTNQSVLTTEIYGLGQLPLDSDDHNEVPADFPDEQEEPKQTELADEECLPVELTFDDYVPISFKLQSYLSGCTTKVYFALPYPPPEQNS